MRRAGEVYVIVKPTGAWLDESVMFAELVKMGKVTALKPSDVLLVVNDSKKMTKELHTTEFSKHEITYDVTKCVVASTAEVVYIFENTMFPLGGEEYLRKLF